MTNLCVTHRYARIGTALLFCGFAVVGAGGCTAPARWLPDHWIADFDTAEQRMRESDRELLIRFTDAAPGRPDPLQAPFASKQVKEQTRDYVRCVLVKSHEPDRRYVAQFGVQRAPAVVILHRDGTYHAQVGGTSIEEFSRFITEAKAPGLEPMINPRVPRRAHYTWHGNIAAAQRAAEPDNRSVLVVYYRRFSGDWSALQRLLSRNEVYSRFAGMIHCRIALWNPWGKTFITPFGAVNLPALVIAGSDGDGHVLEMPTSYEAIVRFADRLGQPDTRVDAS